MITDCSIGQFKCAIGGGCIDLEYVCDGIEQCADRSDEWNCLKMDKIKINGTDAEANYAETYLLVG